MSAEAQDLIAALRAQCDTLKAERDFLLGEMRRIGQRLCESETALNNLGYEKHGIGWAATVAAPLEPGLYIMDASRTPLARWDDSWEHRHIVTLLQFTDVKYRGSFSVPASAASPATFTARWQDHMTSFSNKPKPANPRNTNKL